VSLIDRLSILEELTSASHFGSKTSNTAPPYRETYADDLVPSRCHGLMIWFSSTSEADAIAIRPKTHDQ
jgi:hypothetical protein